MSDRLDSIEGAVRELERRLAAFEARLAAVEHGAAIDGALEPPEPVRSSIVGGGDVAALLAYGGRSFVALGGAFLLRAVTDAHVIPRGNGIAAGLAYGLFWLWMVDRSGATDRLSASCHGLVAATIVFPLLWEATTRFDVLTPTMAAVGLTVVTAAALAVSLHRSIEATAWIVTVAALATAIAFVVATTVLLPFALFLASFGVATLWIGYAFNWTLLRWPVAAAANLTIVGLTMRGASNAHLESPFSVVAAQLFLLNAYIISIAIRTLVRGRNVNAFEIIQTLAVLTVGFGGAVYVAHQTAAGVVPLALVNMAAGASCYAVAWVFVARRQGLARNFYFYTSLGIVLLLVSTRLLLADRELALSCSALAVLACTVANRSSRTVLAWHGLVYLVVALVGSGALLAAADALVGDPTVPWRPFTPTAVVAAASSAVCWLVTPRVLFGALVAWTAGGWLASSVAPTLCGVPGAGADAGAVATVRTTVLSAAALVSAWIARNRRFRDTLWLLYALLGTGAIKLVAEDLPHSQPSTLFVALAFYGAALIAASRLALSRGRQYT